MAKSCTVLVVEDEPLIRLDLVSMLKDQGCETYEASNAAEAIAILEGNSEITVVFTDIQMPGSMDGIDLAEWIGREMPRVKVLLTSGRIARDQVGDWPMLAKPYRLGELEGQLRQFLDPS